MASNEQIQLPPPGPQEDSAAEQAAREAKVRRVVSMFKTIADLGTAPSARGRMDAVQRLASVAAAQHVLRAEQEKAARQDDWEATSLAALVESKLGTGWVELEPDTILDAVALTPEQLTRVLCARHVLYDHTPFTDWHVFEKVAVAFNNRVIDFEEGQDFTPAELAWAVTQMRLIDPVFPFSSEVKKYIAFHLKLDGLVHCPPELSFCEPDLLELVSQFGRDTHANLRTGVDDKSTEHQKWLAAVCAHYVSSKLDKVAKELEAVAT